MCVSCFVSCLCVLHSCVGGEVLDPNRLELGKQRDTEIGHPDETEKGVRASDPAPKIVDSAVGMGNNVETRENSHISDDSDEDEGPLTDYRKSGWGWEEDLPLNHPTCRWWSTFGSQVDDLQEHELVVLPVDGKWMIGEITRVTGSGNIVFRVYGQNDGNRWRVLPGWRKARGKETLFAKEDPGKPWIHLMSTYLMHGSINKYMVYIAGLKLDEKNEVGTDVRKYITSCPELCSPPSTEDGAPSKEQGGECGGPRDSVEAAK